MIRRDYRCNTCGNSQKDFFKIIAVAGTAFDYNKTSERMEFGICSVIRCLRCSSYSTMFRKTADVKVEQVERFKIDGKTRKRVKINVCQMAYKMGNKIQYCLV